jgi:hypothetical protein
MASSRDLSAAFHPKPAVSRTFGRATVSIYPDLTDNMSHAEKSHGFMITKSSLETAKVTYAQRLQILSSATGTPALVSVLRSWIIQTAKALIRTANNFELLSYHGRSGRIMANALDANGILRPTDGMTNATRRPAGIMYAKITCDLTFASFDEDNVATSPYSFFIRLHTETITVQNSTGNDVVLNTFHGDSNWNLSADQADVNAVFDYTRSYGKPFTLKPPTIALDVHADAVLEDLTSTLEDISPEASWPTITTKVLTQLCPNMIEEPTSVIQNIHLVTTDDKGSSVVQPVTQYFKSIISQKSRLGNGCRPAFYHSLARLFSPRNECRQVYL